jgi:lipoprotein signal peptidase
MAGRAKTVLAVAMPVILFASDRLAKWYAQAALSQDGGAVLLPGLNFGYFLNPGLVFSTFGPTVAVIASALAFGALAALALHQGRKLAPPLPPRALCSFLLIASGGISNIFDRLAHGGVIDYILFARSAWNIADIMILAGLALTLWRSPTGGKRTGG